MNYLEKLEFNKIKNKLATYCKTYIGNTLCNKLVPSNIKEDVFMLLSETEEAVNMVYRNTTPSFIDIADISIHLKILESYNVLSMKFILDLGNIFKLAEDLKNYFNKDFIDLDEYPILTKYFKSLYTNSSITTKIFNSIIDDSNIDDRASATLCSIRKKQRKLEQDIKAKLNSMLHSPTYSKYIQENLVTIRNDRFVIPVKEECRSHIKGFVHDISNGGSTLFIEPTSVFELNSELSNLKIEEEIEIEKILKELSKLFYPYVEELKQNVETIGNLDFIFAKASYSKSINAITPIINDCKEINLINARHPLIDANLVVPICINLGRDFSTLLITGPNTGGKTVSLKTVGLLTCMACSGLNIPADNKSSIYVFDNIFADIGDDQSISDSLSTFSSHMLNIVDIIKHATNNSLILVDELGSGTDPIEGANLAISILSYFKSKNCLTIATTHYQELKQYALTTPGFENASVEFDIKSLLPTYKLLVGIPGKSNAFEISKTLGLPDSIINNAKLLMSSEQVSFEELLKNIYDNKASIEKEKEEIEIKLKNISKLEATLVYDNTEIKNKEQELINNAKLKARDILLDAKEDAKEIIKQLSNLENSNLKSAEGLRNNLNKKIKAISISDNSNSNTTKSSLDTLKPNMHVFVKTLGKDGVVLSYPSKSNDVQVQVGIMKIAINIKDLELPHNDKNSTLSNSNIKTSGYTSVLKSKTVKSEINVIGQNVKDAVFVVDKFLDDCSLARLQSVRIVHGKGTGKLKSGIHDFLKNHPHVESFRMGTYGEGEMGVTIVYLK